MPTPPPAPYKLGEASYEDGDLHLSTKFENTEIIPLVQAIIDYNKKPEDKRPEVIRIFINSGGGEVSACLHLIDIMKQSAIPVHTYGMGLVASCAFMTLMAGEKRFATQNTLLMSHQYSGGSGGKEHELQASQRRMEIISFQLMDHYRKCTGKTEKYIRKHLLPASDVWLTAAECVTHNVIDEVIKTY
jgi:ATP-dependent Clp protease protease subunit